jgi:hypothetical protein
MPKTEPGDKPHEQERILKTHKAKNPEPLPPWLWIVYADGSDNKAEASKYWGKGK